MNLHFPTEAEAQTACDGVHAYLIEHNADYAASVLAGHTLKWADPVASGNEWTVPLDMRCKYFDAARKPAEDAAWEAIKAERDRRQHAGVKVGAKWFHSDADSRIQQIGLVMFGANLPAGLQWKTQDGSFVAMTPLLAQQIFQATALSDVAIFQIAEGHKAAMEKSADPAGYDFSSGWPAVFA